MTSPDPADLDDLAEHINTVARLTGTFTLRSGQLATEYFDKYRFEAQPALLARIAAALAPMVPEGTEALAGLEMGGIPIDSGSRTLPKRPDWVICSSTPPQPRRSTTTT